MVDEQRVRLFAEALQAGMLGPLLAPAEVAEDVEPGQVERVVGRKQSE